MEQNGFDVSDVYANGHRTGAFTGSILPELDEAFTIEFRQSEPSEPAFKVDQARRFGSADPFPDLLEVFAMLSHKVAGCPKLFRLCEKGWLAAIDPTFDLYGPLFGIFSSEECFAGLLAFAANLRAPLPLRRTCVRQEPDVSFVKVATACALRVH